MIYNLLQKKSALKQIAGDIFLQGEAVTDGWIADMLVFYVQQEVCFHMKQHFTMLVVGPGVLANKVGSDGV